MYNTMMIETYEFISAEKAMDVMFCNVCLFVSEIILKLIKRRLLINFFDGWI